ncbi:SRPBCC family protein [Noviherbaspirillum sp. UKPF54]|uniref:SRPBCC family protein n=1 Tax=Noviherbaspirillum sp. UKPF54 TaxID=2601898 RepID=UPI00143DAD83|nr:SRPBCC family protein [Noviherbaspirillum sp. UKPF54]
MYQESSKNQSWTAVLGAVALGAAAMYLSDPDRGRRRRALIRDKARSAVNKTGNAIDVASRDLGNRMQGLRAQGRRMLRRGAEADDQVVAARVRQCLGRCVSHPHAVKVNAMQGCVALSGPILAAEKERLLDAVRSVSGVSEIDDRLTVHESAEGVAALQGGRRLAQSRYLFMQDNWPPALRAIAVMGGGAIGYAGVARRGPAGALAAVLGLGMVLRGALNRPLWRRAGSRAMKPLDLHKTIYINASPERVFDTWSKYENFPRFMSNVQQVQDMGNGRSHWTVSGPVGTQVEWDSTLTESRRPELLAWRTEPDAALEHNGRVRFEAVDGGTRVTVDMTYSPPAGTAGEAFASLFAGSPTRQLDEDLMHMKSFIESGVPPHDASKAMQQQPIQQPQRMGDVLH